MKTIGADFLQILDMTKTMIYSSWPQVISVEYFLIFRKKKLSKFSMQDLFMMKLSKAQKATLVPVPL
jgi:hypothetical protein